MPLIGMFMNLAEDDREVSNRRDLFLQGLGPMGDLRIAMRFGGERGGHIVDYGTYRKKADDLAKLNPDLYICSCWPTLRALLDRRVKSTPIVFAGLAHTYPTTAYEDNVFGFVDYGANLCVQWPAYLSLIAPDLKRAAVVYDVNPPGDIVKNKDYVYNIIDGAKGNLALEVIDVRPDDKVEDAIKKFANGGPGGLIVPASTPMGTIRHRIIPAAACNKLPAIYGNRLYAIHGGLISRGALTTNLYFYAGNYAKQILNGMTPTPAIDLTQTGKYPNKPALFETVINLNVAKALGGNILTNAKTIPADLAIEPE